MTPFGAFEKIARMSSSPITLLPGPDGTFRGTAMAEAGTSSAGVDRAWLTAGSTWGRAHVVITALDDHGAVMRNGVLEADIDNNRRVVLELPSGVVMATVEGVAEPGAIVAAAVVSIPKPIKLTVS